MSEPSDLARRAYDEVAACIGCNDCMLVCPLPQAKIVTIAELNAAVQESTVTNPRVVDFVTSCTQCRQCVPACPAQLSRADMVLYNKIKVEDAVVDYRLKLQVGTATADAPWTLDGLSAELASLPLFSGVDVKDVRRMLLSVTLRRLSAGEILCKEGAFNERLVVVLYGALEQFQVAAGGAEVPIVNYGPGSFLGEMGVLADQPEPFGIRAVQATAVLEVPKAAAVRLMERSPPFRNTMDDLYRRRALWTYARSPQALGNLPEEAVRELLDRASLVPIREGDVVFRQGQAPESLFLVRSGFLRVTQEGPEGSRVLLYFREGELFGAMGLLLGESAQVYTVTAATRAELIQVSGAVLFDVVGRYPGAREALSHALESERVARSPALNAAPLTYQDGRTHLLPLSVESLLEAGLAKGKEILVVDQTKCTYCQGCVEACERRHGHARLELRGLQLEHLLFPTACRHCDDPVCLLCSVNGIVRRTSGEITIVPDNCIGCGACAKRCPYGNIQMHPIAPEPRGVFDGLLEFLGSQRAKRKAQPEPREDVPKRAVKCDLCAEYQDYACVTACPTGAAFRTDLDSVLGSEQRLPAFGSGRPSRA